MESKQIRLFASDMDGTLLRRDFSISEENIQAVKQLEKTGILFVVATGRIWYDAHEICRAHGINPFIISNNGTCVFMPDGKQIYSKEIPESKVSVFVEILERCGICFGLGTANNFIVNSNWKAILDNEIKRLERREIYISKEKVNFVKKELIEQNGVQEVMDVRYMIPECGPVYSISLATYDEKELKYIQKIVDDNPELMLSISGTHNAEIMQKEGTKAHALEFLCKELDIAIGETAAIGDSLNDFHMIQSAGTGFAVGNARDEIKDISDYITKRFDDHGVANAIHMILKDQ